MKRCLSILALLLWFAGFGFAAQPITTVTDTLRDAQGNLAVGHWLISWPQFLSPETATCTVIGATNATPIVVQCSAPHGYATSDTVYETGALGNTAANGSFTITVTDTTHFSLNGSVGNGAWTSGGTAQRFFAVGPGTLRVPASGDFTGTFTTTLTPTTNATSTPGGAATGVTYFAQFVPTTPAGPLAFPPAEHWNVPTSTPASLSQVRTAVVVTPTSIVLPSQIQQAGATTTQALVWNGSQWAPANQAGSVTSVGLLGTANQITVTGTCTITTSGICTFSFPVGGVTLPGTTTGTFSGNLTGNVTGNASGSAASFTGSLVGDVSGTQGATSVDKIKGTTVPTNSAADQFLGTTASAIAAWASIPLCGDSSHALAYSTATHAFSCQSITGSAGTPSFPVNPQTATYQALAADFSSCKVITVASGTFTVTLVASGSQPSNGQCIWVVNYGSGVVTIARSGQNINGGTASLTLAAASATAPTGAFIVSDSANYFAQTFGGASSSSSSLLDYQKQGSSITGDSTDHTIYSTSIPGGTIAAGHCLKIDVAWHGSGTNTTYKLFYGSAALPIWFGAQTDFFLADVYICNDPGSTSSQQFTAATGFFLVAGSGIQQVNSSVTNGDIQTLSIDTTATQTLKFTFNVASPATASGLYWNVSLH